MPLFDIIVLSAIITVFTAFGVVLAGVAWYCGGKQRPAQRHRHGHHRGDWSVIIDD